MSCAFLVNQSELCFLQRGGEGLYFTTRVIPFPKYKKNVVWGLKHSSHNALSPPHQKVLRNDASERCRQKCNHTPIYNECENKYTYWQIHNPKFKYDMNTNLIKMSFAVVEIQYSGNHTPIFHQCKYNTSTNTNWQLANTKVPMQNTTRPSVMEVSP